MNNEEGNDLTGICLLTKGIGGYFYAIMHCNFSSGLRSFRAGGVPLSSVRGKGIREGTPVMAVGGVHPRRGTIPLPHQDRGISHPGRTGVTSSQGRTGVPLQRLARTTVSPPHRPEWLCGRGGMRFGFTKENVLIPDKHACPVLQFLRYQLLFVENNTTLTSVYNFGMESFQITVKSFSFWYKLALKQ